MTNKTEKIAAEILSALEPAMSARSSAHFFEGVRAGYDKIYNEIVQAKNQNTAIASLDKAFELTKAERKKRHILEFCSWPIFDKVSLPNNGTSPPEFLWMFALPFVIRFGKRHLKEPVLLDGTAVDAQAILERLTDCDVINPDAFLTGFTTLLAEKDIRAYGPQQLANIFAKGERGAEVDLQPLPLVFDPDMDSSRTVLLYLPAAAQLVIGEKQLRDNTKPWPEKDLAKMVLEGLREKGLSVESVTSLPPAAMAETLLRCSQPAMQEMADCMGHAARHFGIKQFLVRVQMPGMFELNGINQYGHEVHIVPPMPFIEPLEQLTNTVQTICEQYQWDFKGTYDLALVSSAMLH